MYQIETSFVYLQIKKCTEADCAYCTLNPPRLSQEMLKDLHFIPDPVLKEDGVFKSNEETYGTPTTDKDRPSLQEKVTTTERDKQLKNLLVASEYLTLLKKKFTKIKFSKTQILNFYVNFCIELSMRLRN